MIRGPYKYDAKTINLANWLGIVTAIIIVGSKTKFAEWVVSLHIPTLISALVIFTVFHLLGEWLAYKYRVLFHTPVTNTITTHKNLEIMHTYYLNGSTEAKFVCDDSDHSGTLVFEIKGVRGDVHLTPDQVKAYLSKTKER